jgi:16S rRNA (cytosine967-C5)-methyltransferase
MNKSIRHFALDILTQIHQRLNFAAPLLDNYLDTYKLSGTPDGKLLTHLVYGELRLQGHLDWIITNLYRGKFENIDEQIKNVLRLALYQLKFSDRLPDFAVVNEAVKITKNIQPDKSGLVNALLRNYLRYGKNISFPSFEKYPAEHIAMFHSHPLWLVKILITIFGTQETIAFCAANNKMSPLTLRVNTLKISREELKAELQSAGFMLTPTTFSPDGLILVHSNQPIQKTDFFRKGLLRIQDEGSQCISYLVNPHVNESILDVCAGSGGKTTHLAAILKNKGHIVAIDSNPEKISELEKESSRMGITSIKTHQTDLSAGLPDELRGKFDHVLVDAPCSGLGTLRRNPEIKWRITADDIDKFASIQKNILRNASLAVKKCGRLIYCTCSILPQENENIITDFLNLNSSFSLCRPPAQINKSMFDSEYFYRTYPHVHNMDGFFGVIFKREQSDNFIC